MVPSPEFEEEQRLARIVSELRKTLASKPRRSAALLAITDSVRDAMDGVDEASIVLWNDPEGSFTGSASSIDSEPADHAARQVRKEGGATRWIIEHGHPLVVSDLRKDPFSPNPMLRATGLAAYAGVPLVTAGAIRGVLYALAREARDFTIAEISFLRVVAAMATEHLHPKRGDR